jgi:hypothetical protein
MPMPFSLYGIYGRNNRLSGEPIQANIRDGIPKVRDAHTGIPAKKLLR